MATVTLQGANSYHYSGVVFWKGDPTAVDDKLARELENFPEYFDIVFDGVKPKTGDKRKAGAAAKVTRAAAVDEPPAVEI